MKKTLNGFILAIRFLTIIPVKNAAMDDEAISISMMFFPVTGFLIGMLVLLPGLLSYRMYPGMTASVLIVFVLAVITGGLHLDGLADTFDGIASSRPRERILEIMKDSRIGTMGVLSLIFVIAFKVFFLASVPASSRSLTIILMLVLSRWSMLVPVYYVRYARVEGLGGTFSKAMNKRTFVTATGVTLALSFILMQFTGILLMLAVTLSTMLISWLISKKIDGFTGDTLGATCEVNEVVVLALMGMGALS